jgi:NTE family protein
MTAGLGLVLSGGFLRSAFQVGVIEELHARGLRFDVVVGVSSGAWNAACVATSQIGEMRDFWLEVARAPKLRLRNLFRHGTPSNFPEIVRRIPARALRFDRLGRSAIRLRVGAMSLRHRRLHLFERWASRDAFLASLMASNYLPGVYGRPIRIGGRYYADGGLVDNVPYEAALEAGCERAIVVVSDSRGLIWKRLLDRRPHRVPPSRRERVLLIHPERPLPIGRVRTTVDDVTTCIDAGRSAARSALRGEIVHRLGPFES